MEPIVNKVAESGIITLNLEQFVPNNMMVFDLKPFLFMEMILKEKDYRAALLAHDWSVYENKRVVITCSVDAIIPVWAYMLAAHYLNTVAQAVYQGSEDAARTHWILEGIQQHNISAYTDERVVIKGCGDIPIPSAAYAAITFLLKPVVKSLMYGEPCSTVPIYKKKKPIE